MSLHDWSALSDVCLACGLPFVGAPAECEPSAAEPDDAEDALARFFAAIDAAGQSGALFPSGCNAPVRGNAGGAVPSINAVSGRPGRDDGGSELRGSGRYAARGDAP